MLLLDYYKKQDFPSLRRLVQLQTEEIMALNWMCGDLEMYTALPLKEV